MNWQLNVVMILLFVVLFSANFPNVCWSKQTGAAAVAVNLTKEGFWHKSLRKIGNYSMDWSKILKETMILSSSVVLIVYMYKTLFGIPLENAARNRELITDSRLEGVDQIKKIADYLQRRAELDSRRLNQSQLQPAQKEVFFEFLDRNRYYLMVLLALVNVLLVLGLFQVKWQTSLELQSSSSNNNPNQQQPKQAKTIIKDGAAVAPAVGVAGPVKRRKKPRKRKKNRQKQRKLKNNQEQSLNGQELDR